MVNLVGGSGSLDVESIVSQLMALERRPLTAMNQREDQYRSQLSAWGSLKTSVNAFEDATEALARPASFSRFAATLSDPSVAALTVTSSAAPATYSLEISQLAASQKLASSQFASASTAVGSGTITFEFGRFDSGAGTFTVNADKPAFNVIVAPGEDSLAAVRSAINAANQGVSATIINDGTGSRLVLTSTDSGEVNSLRITVADDDGGHTDATGLSALAYDPTAAVGGGKNLSQLVAAANAQLTLDGIAITSASNQVATAVDGITFSLAKTTTAPVSVTVGRDHAKLTETVDGFVKTFNALNKQIRDLTFYDPNLKTAGKLQGESAVTTLQNRIRAGIGAMAADPGAAYQRLSDLGIAVQADGSLRLDNAKLEAALKANPNAVIALFVGAGANPSSTALSTGGVAGELKSMLDQMLGGSGLFVTREESLGASVRRIDDEQLRFERRLELIEKRYRQQFSGLDRMLAGLNEMSMFLSRL